MTAVDSQTVVSLDTPVFVFSAKKDNDNAQVGAPNGTSEGVETPEADSDFVYFRKGDGRRPVVGGMKSKLNQTTKPSSSSKQNSSSTSSKNNPPPKPPQQRPVTTNPPKTSQGSSKDKAKK